MFIAFLLLLSMRLKLLAILLHEQFIHHKQINLCPNKQLLSTQQHSFQSFKLLPVTALIFASWVNFRYKCYIRTRSYPTTMYESIFAQMYVFLVVFTIFAFYHDFLSKTYFSTMYIHCRRITVVHIYVNAFFFLQKFTQSVKVSDANGIKPASDQNGLINTLF